MLCLGHIADPQGKKMSKSLGNIVVPWDVIHQHGADAFRWYYLTSKQPWDGYLFSTETVGESVRQFLLQLWNTYGFYVLYANVNDVQETAGPATELDRWALSRLQATIAEVRERMEDYDATRAGQAIAAFSDELSNWYVRRSRRRFWDGEAAAFGTLKTCLVELTKLLAPFCPFVADAIYENLDGSEPSVHLTDFPEADPALRDARARGGDGDRARDGPARPGRARARQAQGPPAAAGRGGRRRGRGARGDRADARHRARRAQRQGAALRQRRPASSAPTRSSPTTAASARASASRCRRSPRRSRRSSPRTWPARCAPGNRVAIAIDGHDHELGPDDLSLAMQPLAGYQLEREGSHAVALELELDDELRREGLAREVVHAVQNARKAAGLDVEDRIALVLGGDEELLGAARAHEGYVTGETLATSIAYDGSANGAEATIDGRLLKVRSTRVGFACQASELVPRRSPSATSAGQRAARSRPRGASSASRPGCAWRPGRRGRAAASGWP